MAGARQEPPVSSHRDHGAKRAAMDAAEPALLPAGVGQKPLDAVGFEA